FLLLMIFTVFEAVAQDPGKLTLRFVHVAEGKPIVLRDSVYATPLGEGYTISKLRYYVSHIQPGDAAVLNYEEPYHLISFPRDTIITLDVTSGTINEVSFLLGIDSTRHCSGAQSGALDPMNDMFWTWNSGYVTFKLDGSSPVSTADRNRIEHHIGGYRGNQKVAQNIRLNLPSPLTLHPGKESVVTILVNLDQYWNAVTPVRISEN